MGRAVAHLQDKLSVTRVSLSMVPNVMESATRLTAEQLVRSGCTVETTDPAQAVSLAALLRDADIAGSAGDDREPRRVLVVEFLDGSRETLRLGTVFPGDARLSGTLDGRPIRADRALHEALWRWAGQIASRSQCGASLDAYR